MFLNLFLFKGLYSNTTVTIHLLSLQHFLKKILKQNSTNTQVYLHVHSSSFGRQVGQLKPSTIDISAITALPYRAGILEQNNFLFILQEILIRLVNHTERFIQSEKSRSYYTLLQPVEKYIINKIIDTFGLDF